MAYAKTEQTDIPYFKPLFKYEYKAAAGTFRGWDFAAKEQSEEKQLNFISAINLFRFESKESSPFEFTSNLIRNIFQEKIHITEIIRADDKPPSYKKRGIIEWNSEIRSFCHEGTDTPADLNGESVLNICGLFETGESLLVTIRGAAKMDLTVDNGTNKHKIEAIKNGIFLNLRAAEDTVKVGKPPKSKQIHLLEIVDLPKALTPEQETDIKQLLKQVNDDCDYHQGKQIKNENLSDVLPLTDEEFDSL